MNNKWAILVNLFLYKRFFPLESDSIFMMFIRFRIVGGGKVNSQGPKDLENFCISITFEYVFFFNFFCTCIIFCKKYWILTKNLFF